MMVRWVVIAAIVIFGGLEGAKIYMKYQIDVQGPADVRYAAETYQSNPTEVAPLIRRYAEACATERVGESVPEINDFAGDAAILILKSVSLSEEEFQSVAATQMSKTTSAFDRALNAGGPKSVLIKKFADTSTKYPNWLASCIGKKLRA